MSEAATTVEQIISDALERIRLAEEAAMPFRFNRNADAVLPPFCFSRFRPRFQSFGAFKIANIQGLTRAGCPADTEVASRASDANAPPWREVRLPVHVEPAIDNWDWKPGPGPYALGPTGPTGAIGPVGPPGPPDLIRAGCPADTEGVSQASDANAPSWRDIRQIEVQAQVDNVAAAEAMEKAYNDMINSMGVPVELYRGYPSGPAVSTGPHRSDKNPD
jgi:hypothetical protein